MPTKTRTPKSSKGLGSYARLHDFVQKQKGESEVNYEKAFKRLLGHLDQRLSGTILFHVTDGQSWLLSLSDSTAKRVSSESKADFKVVTKTSALENILSGKNSPVISMAKHEMAFHGDTDLGKSLYQALAADDGNTDPCK